MIARHFLGPIKNAKMRGHDRGREKHARAATSGMEQKISVKMKTYMCVVCGFVYDEEQGLPEHGIRPGTRWEEIPETWTCPDCGASKEEFELIEI